MRKRDREILNEEMVQKITNKVHEVLQQAKSIWPEHQSKFDTVPEIFFNLKSKVGGLAINSCRLGEAKLRFNPILCYENEEHYLSVVVPHEVAHIITGYIYGATKTVKLRDGTEKQQKIRSHGREWKEVMTKLGQVPSVYHDMDVITVAPPRPPRKKTSGLLAQIRMVEDMQKKFNKLPPVMQQEFVSWAWRSS